MAGGIYTLTILDYSKEKSTSRFNTGAVTAVSLPGLLTQIGALRTAVDGISLGTMARESLQVFDTPLSNEPPVDKNAQREDKWLITYEDNTQYFDPPTNAIPNEGYKKAFSVEIACPDRTLVVNNTDFADITAAPMSTFVTAFEAMCKSPYGGTAHVLSAKYVGRNL